ncbi:MAG: phosphoribosyl-ATP diphosphatase, partial [bacterium]|nr:phosphoribosyl-ATP diphosphatase [bacterium]
QKLVRVDLDCDRDALRFTVQQNAPGFCHRGTRTCWGDERGWGTLARRLAERVRTSQPGSYTCRLLEDPALLRSKLVEEAEELAEADTPASITWEAADVLYFLTVALTRAGVSPAQVEAELDRRSLVVSRRPGDAKTKSEGGP